MKDTIPRFSILMACWNHAAYVEAAVRSVMAQTFTDWELVFVDDASTDNTAELLKPLLADTRIRTVTHAENKGYIAALITAIDAARGAIMAIVDADDALTPQALAVMDRAYDDRPACGFIYSRFLECDAGLNPTGPGYSAPLPKGLTNLECNCVSHLKTFRKEVYKQTAGLDPALIYAEDRDLVFKLEEVTSLGFVDEVLYLHRNLPASQSNDPARRETAWKSFYAAQDAARKRRGPRHLGAAARLRLVRFKLGRRLQRTFSSGGPA